MRPGERAMWERLGDIVQLGKRRGVSVTCNGDGNGWANWEKIRDETGEPFYPFWFPVLKYVGADSLMLARAAERNPSIFLPTGPRSNLSEIVPRLLNIAEYVENPWGNTKFLLTQFKASPSPISDMSKQQRKEAQDAVAHSKALIEVAEKLGIELGGGKAVINEIETAIGTRGTQDSNVFEERREAEAHGCIVEETALDNEEEETNDWATDIRAAYVIQA